MTHHDQPAATLYVGGKPQFICYERCLYCGRRVALGHQACLRDIGVNGREVAMTEDDDGWKAVDFSTIRQPRRAMRVWQRSEKEESADRD